MTRGIVVLIGLVGAVCVTIGADDKDAVKEKLYTAKTAYDTEMKQYRKLAEEWFDKREEVVRKDGNKKLVDQIKAERVTFDESGALPKGAPAAIREKPALAWKKLEMAHAHAVKEYTKLKKDAEAAAIEEQWKVLESVRAGTAVKPPNPLKTGSAVYEAFPAADRPKLIKDWESELEALKRAIKGDEERLAKATTPKDKAHFTRLIADYKQKLAKHEINDPPYIQKK